MRRVILPAMVCLTLLGALPAASAGGAPAAAPPAVPVASITAVLQSGLLLRAGAGHPTAAAPFTPLFTGDRVRTPQGQRTAILLRDGSQFLLNQNTDLGIAFPILRLYRGEIFARIAHSGNFHVVVRTDAAVAAVEGTQFDISAGLPSSPADTVLTVVEGRVRLSNAHGSVLVLAGEQATANPNTAPSQPVVVQVGGIVRWTSQVELITTIALPPHYPTPHAAAVAARAALAWLAVHPGDAQARLALADALADQGSAGNAQQQYRRALALLASSNVSGRMRAEIGIAATAFALGDLTGTAAAVAAALALDPSSLEAGLLRGDVALARGDLQGALGAYVALRRLYPHNPRPLVAVGFVLMLQRGTTEARIQLQAALRLRPPGWLVASVLVDLGAIAGFQGDRAGALAYDLRAVTADPRAAIAWIGVGTALGELGRYSEAIQPLTIAGRLGASFERATALDDLGEADYELGLLPKELAAYRAALALNPTDAVAANGMGTAELALGQTTLAIAYTGRAARLAPGLSDLVADYARALWSAHQDMAAEAVCTTALRRDHRSAALYLVLGYALEDAGQTAAAHAAYARAYALRPLASTGAEDAAFAGELAYYAGHMGEAIADLRLSAALHPANYHTWELLSLAEQRAHTDRQAIVAARQAIALNPRDIVAHLVLSQSYERLGDDQGAAAEDHAVLRLDPRQPTMHADLGLIAQRAGHLIAARDQFLTEIRVQSMPPNGGPRAASALAVDWAELGLIYDALHDPRNGANAYVHALHYNPHKGSYYLLLGRDEQALGQFVQAIASFSAAIHINPRDGNAYYDRGALALRLGILGPAVRDLAHAVALEPRDAPSRLEYGIALERAGRYAAARDQYRIAATLLQGKPLQAAAWNKLGNALDELQDYKDAISAYAHAVALNPRSTVVHSALGLDLLRTNQLAAARVQFQIVVAQNPHDSFAYFDLAAIDAQQGRLARALQEIGLQIAVNQGHPALLAIDYRLQGFIYTRQQGWHEAVSSFGWVIVFGKPTDQDYYNLGYAQEQTGDRAGARRNLARAYELARAGDHTALGKATCKELTKLGAPCA